MARAIGSPPTPPAGSADRTAGYRAGPAEPAGRARSRPRRSLTQRFGPVVAACPRPGRPGSGRRNHRRAAGGDRAISRRAAGLSVDPLGQKLSIRELAEQLPMSGGSARPIASAAAAAPSAQHGLGLQRPTSPSTQTARQEPRWAQVRRQQPSWAPSPGRGALGPIKGASSPPGPRAAGPRPGRTDVGAQAVDGQSVAESLCSGPFELLDPPILRGSKLCPDMDKATRPSYMARLERTSGEIADIFGRNEARERTPSFTGSMRSFLVSLRSRLALCLGRGRRLSGRAQVTVGRRRARGHGYGQQWAPADIIVDAPPRCSRRRRPQPA